mmetsp:Transcript_5647/g.8183  ORF Transcript_5647/g.8183 Transcript_5647/m.8183 type:complete len:234 (+) Transcript_5647:56-757(+)|eukprot:CAMPEP_0194239746 /NCGR_PEP_ID=MMETSP0158-20130606/6115_1 /TAXON_ID=33649 /ORGANISM="Thalassionema nitzschioides, Strain L26-B" /LENGTH=233 /DNA_ID=CAMNT_0038974291 /DNA_START=59 /DNA_END=760 /DNA_ORIENTATION=-
MSFEKYQTESLSKATLLKNNASNFLQNIESTFQQHFSIVKMSEAGRSYQTQELLQKNPVVIAALSASQDAVMQALDDFSNIEDYVTLHVPKMEDGNNFGVTVQLEALKQVQNSAEGLSKSLDELAKYYTARADAMDKLQLASENSSETKKEENDGKETKTTLTKETKMSCGKQEFHRVQAVYAVDTQYYAIARKTLRAVRSAYIANVDYIIKNFDKIEAPKGSSGVSSFNSMY